MPRWPWAVEELDPWRVVVPNRRGRYRIHARCYNSPGLSPFRCADVARPRLLESSCANAAEGQKVRGGGGGFEGVVVRRNPQFPDPDLLLTD